MPAKKSARKPIAKPNPRKLTLTERIVNKLNKVPMMSAKELSRRLEVDHATVASLLHYMLKNRRVVRSKAKIRKFGRNFTVYKYAND